MNQLGMSIQLMSKVHEILMFSSDAQSALFHAQFGQCKNKKGCDLWKGMFDWGQLSWERVASQLSPDLLSFGFRQVCQHITWDQFYD